MTQKAFVLCWLFGCSPVSQEPNKAPDKSTSTPTVPTTMCDDRDLDGVCDEDDACDGDDLAGDSDADGTCDDLDPCPGDALDDSDGDGSCDSDDLCIGDDDLGDDDGDGVCGGLLADADDDADGVPNALDCDPADPTSLEDGVAVAQAKSPWLYWSFWNGGAEDFTANQRHGTVTDPVNAVLQPGLASDSALGIGTDTTNAVEWSMATVPTGDFSVSLWLRTTDRTGGIFSYATIAGSDNDVLLYLDGVGGAVHRSGYWLGDLAFGTTLFDGGWHHVALVWETNGDLDVFVDGINRHSSFYPANPLSQAGTLMLGQEQDCVGGCLDANQALDGAFDEFAIYSVALSAAEVGRIARPCLTRTDLDGDGLSDAVEAALLCDPALPDTDGDGLTDGLEVYDARTDPLNPDTDGDGTPDGSDLDPLDPAV